MPPVHSNMQPDPEVPVRAVRIRSCETLSINGQGENLPPENMCAHTLSCICVYKNSLPQTIRKPQSIILLYSFLTSGLGSVYRKNAFRSFGCMSSGVTVRQWNTFRGTDDGWV